MQLYKIKDKGELLEVDQLEFEENDAYLVDDEEHNTIYIWVGLKVIQDKKDAIARIAQKLDSAKSAKILIMKQKREYGSFLSMMHNLKKGLIPGKIIERRPEFVFKSEAAKFIPIGTDTSVSKDRFDEPEKDQQFDDIEESSGEQDLKTQVKEAAYYLSQKGYTYNDLCWILAESIQKTNLSMPSIQDIKRKAEEVFSSSCTYDELCWLNSEMDILIKKSYIEKKFQY